MSGHENCPAVCSGGIPTLWQNLCAARFLGAADPDGTVITPGYYSPVTQVGTAKSHGDFGVGEFERLRGELFAYNNEFYEISADGVVRKATDSDWLNVAFLTFFRPVHRFYLDTSLAFNVAGKSDSTQIEHWLRARLASLDCFYAITITGRFESITVSAIPEQYPPYIPFSEARRLRKERTTSDDTGRMVGFYTPEYLGCVGVPGCHFHFLNDSLSIGGHVEQFTVDSGLLELQRIDSVQLGFPDILPD